jgi:hypothetical protein
MVRHFARQLGNRLTESQAIDSPTTSAPHSKSLLTLPLEMRHRSWRYVIKDSETIVLCPIILGNLTHRECEEDTCLPPRQENPFLSLKLINKQCKAEIDSLNTTPKVIVQLCSLQCAKEWLFMATPRERKAVGRIEFYDQPVAPSHWEALLKKIRTAHHDVCRKSLNEYYRSVVLVKSDSETVTGNLFAAFMVSEARELRVDQSLDVSLFDDLSIA